MTGIGRMLAAVLMVALAGSGMAHSGGLNAQGCHNDRKHGGYHCHRGPRAGQEQTPLALEPPAPANRSPGVVSYANCPEARAAGAASIRRGEPGYASHLDRDDDGIACE